MLTEREKTILGAVVEEYTHTGLPVGSSVVVEKYLPDVSPATVRAAMAQMEEDGIFYQPHVSAGRVPTDRGYRLFVEEVMPERDLTRGEQQTLQRELLKLRAQNVRLTRTLAKLLALSSGSVGLSGRPDADEYHEFGLQHLLSRAAPEDLDDVCRLAEVLDYIDERCDALLSRLRSTDEPQFFIGEENPVAGMERHAVVVSSYRDRDGQEGIIAIIGPKNMPYARNRSIVDYVRRFLRGDGKV